MTNNVAVGLHQQAEFRETIVLHGGWGDFADEAHERQTCGRKQTSVALNLERGLIGIVAISTRIVGMAHYQNREGRLQISVPLLVTLVKKDEIVRTVHRHTGITRLDLLLNVIFFITDVAITVWSQRYIFGVESAGGQAIR